MALVRRRLPVALQFSGANIPLDPIGVARGLPARFRIPDQILHRIVLPLICLQPSHRIHPSIEDYWRGRQKGRLRKGGREAMFDPWKAVMRPETGGVPRRTEERQGPNCN